MANKEEQSRIHKLRQQLYSRGYTSEEDKRTEITSKEVEGVQSDWNTPTEEKSNKKRWWQKEEGFFVKWILILSILFFLVSFVIAAFIFLRGSANISSHNVDIRILGPVATPGGEELSLEVIVDNKNNVDIESAVVLVEYPDGARRHDNLNEPLIRDQNAYGTIASGSNTRQTFRSVLFGEQQSVKEIKVTLEYRVRGSSATFAKEKLYEIQISSSPVLVDIQYPNQVRSDQQIEFVVDVTSNSSAELNNVLLRAEYPFGFSFSEADPDPTFDTDIFFIGRLRPEEKKTIRIRGILQAQDNEERTFRFNIGTESDTDERELGAVYVASSRTVTITEPSIALSATVGGSSAQDVAVRSGQNVSTVISWFNNLSTRVVNANLTATLGGSMIDRSTLAVGAGGFFRSATDTVEWTQNTQQGLAEIAPGNRGTVNFDFNIQKLTSQLANSMRNPEISIVFDIEGTRFSEGNVPERVETSVTRNIRVASDMDFSARAVRTLGPLENTGPIPPKVDQETTYTIIWSLTNSYNDVRNIRAVAQLPAYVEWEGIFSPSSENISFNPITNQVIWEIDTLSAGAGFSSSPREVAFRLAVTPSLTQVGSRPVIIQQASVQGRDSFTDSTLTDSFGPLTTHLTTDPGLNISDSEVVQ